MMQKIRFIGSFTLLGIVIASTLPAEARGRGFSGLGRSLSISRPSSNASKFSSPGSGLGTGSALRATRRLGRSNSYSSRSPSSSSSYSGSNSGSYSVPATNNSSSSTYTEPSRNVRLPYRKDANGNWIYSGSNAPARAIKRSALARTISLPNSFTAQCTSVVDGDTIKVLYDNIGVVTVHLYGIDAPELGARSGIQARALTSSILLNQYVTVYCKGKDSRGRIKAWVFAGSRCANAELVKVGLAKWDKRLSPRETKLQQWEKQAKLQHIGIWR